jgi:serine-type D-Ala-D-Ala carboxypeptidase/endopeptidase (penicillin-binding protein 4)
MNQRDPSRSRRRAPIAVLVVVALVPALALSGLWWWAEDEASSPVPTTTTTVPDAPPADALPTALASLRRVPEPIAAAVTEARTAELFQPFVQSIGPASCAAIAIDGDVIAAANPDLGLVPASTQKVVVAAVALDVLGADHRFVTEVRAAPLVDGVLTGDLYLVGGGDPLLASADVVDDLRFPAFNTTSMDELADRLVAAGLVIVDGDVVGDGSRYDDEFVVPSWGDDITRRDAGPYDALLVNDGRLFGSGYGLNPNQSAASELNRLLTARGVQVTGRNRADTAPDGLDGLDVLASIESVPLTGVIEEMLHTSDNNTAEMLVKEIGAVEVGEGTRAAGLGVIRDRLASWGVPLDAVVLDDGSGLSRANRLTCGALLTVLEQGDVSDSLEAALPVAGRSGNLIDQLADSAVAGELRGKTGTLTDVKALAGLLPSDDGGRFAFSIISNEAEADEVAVHRPVWDALFDVFGEYPVDVSVDEFSPR